ncbi:ABC transporter permease subunit [Tuanshanicoccus lijuaniae]|uniref:ABC transporter permease n=1 Tax=Aerococcaceae bacterium zg-1292 TaxID=2774330 RepID=UPI001938FD9B|nr:ABC transporter permease subunit [Aerococcaceae bacterium zg-1292]QQA36306.1 ABC transporter permease subunit [Aerococcaceae bacterium zg-1292]
MKIFISLLKKELLETIRTKKLLSMFVLFIFIGLISPLSAKLMPIILKSLAAEGIDFKLPPPMEKDSWQQFFKNINQLGLFGLVIIFSTHMTNEIQKGTLINLLSKGLPRFNVVLSKFFSELLIWTSAYAMSFLIAFGYTKYFFDTSISFQTILTAALLPFIFGISIISLELLGSVVTDNVIGALVFVALSVLIQFILSLKEDVLRYLPIALLQRPLLIIKGTVLTDYHIPVLTTFGLTFICIICAIWVLNRKEIS